MNPPMYVRRKRPAKWKGRLAVGAAIATVAAGTFFGGRAFHQKRVRFERQRVGIEQVITQKKIVRDPKTWSRISMVYGWNPATPSGLQRIMFIESISKKTGIPARNVLLTIEYNPITDFQAGALIRGGNPRAAKVIEALLTENHRFTQTVSQEVMKKKGSLEEMKKL